MTSTRTGNWSTAETSETTKGEGVSVVITQAGNDDKVKALVYVAAFAPSEGQSASDLGQGYPTPPGSAFIVPDKSRAEIAQTNSLLAHPSERILAWQTGLNPQIMGRYSHPASQKKPRHLHSGVEC